MPASVSLFGCVFVFCAKWKWIRCEVISWWILGTDNIRFAYALHLLIIIWPNNWNFWHRLHLMKWCNSTLRRFGNWIPLKKLHSREKTTKIIFWLMITNEGEEAIANIFHNRGKSVAIGKENYILKYPVILTHSLYSLSMCVSVCVLGWSFFLLLFIIKWKMPSRQKSETMFLMFSSFWIFLFMPWLDTKSRRRRRRRGTEKPVVFACVPNGLNVIFWNLSNCKVLVAHFRTRFFGSLLFTAWEIYRLCLIYLY